jgi:predicted ATP-dependent serine protease
MGKTLYLSIEEGAKKSATVHKRLKTFNLKSRSLILSSVSDYEKIIAKIKEIRPKNLFIDSISVSQINILDLAKIYEFIDGMMLFITHSNKDESFKGNSELGHFVDVLLKAQDGIITQEKNRFNFDSEEKTYQVF